MGVHKPFFGWCKKDDSLPTFKIDLRCSCLEMRACCSCYAALFRANFVLDAFSRRGQMASIDVLQLGVIPHLVEKCLCADFLCKQSWRPHSDIFMACFQLIISVQASCVDFLQLRLGVLSFWRKLLFGCALLNFVPQILSPAFSMISKAMFIRLPLVHKGRFCWRFNPASCVHKDDFS